MFKTISQAGLHILKNLARAEVSQVELFVGNKTTYFSLPKAYGLVNQTRLSSSFQPTCHILLQQRAEKAFVVSYINNNCTQNFRALSQQVRPAGGIQKHISALDAKRPVRKRVVREDEEGSPKGLQVTC